MLPSIGSISRLRRGTTRRFSSWDRSGRNGDCIHIPAGKSVVLADITGPGHINHIWLTQYNHYREVLIRITWDGEKGVIVGDKKAMEANAFRRDYRKPWKLPYYKWNA